MIELEVSARHHVVLAQSLVRQAARAAGAGRVVAEELAIVASELATNMVRHAGSGQLRVLSVWAPADGCALVIAAQDPAPCEAPLLSALGASVEESRELCPKPVPRAKPLAKSSMLPGGGSLGAGLLTVRRLSDLVMVEGRIGGKALLSVRCICGPTHHEQCRQTLSGAGFSSDQPSRVIFTSRRTIAWSAKPT